jgi:prophage regulatory protein
MKIVSPAASAASAVSDSEPDEILIRIDRVMQLTGLTPALIYKAMKAGTFPHSVKIGPKAVAWRKSEVLQWIDAITRA